MKNNLEIGKRIRTIRETMNLTKSSFSEKINISETFLSQIERGEKSVSLNTLLSICNNTGFSADYILFGETNTSSISNRIVNILNQLPPEVNTIVYDMTCSLNSLYNKNKNKND